MSDRAEMWSAIAVTAALEALFAWSLFQWDMPCNEPDCHVEGR